MNINIVCCLFVLENVKNENIRKNDDKKIKVLVKKNDKSLPNILFNDTNDIKEVIRNHISNIITSKLFHLEQVYTLGDKKYFEDEKIDIIHLAVTNEENIKSLDRNYELIDFKIENNNLIFFGDSKYTYHTIEKETEISIEYLHNIDVEDILIEKKLLELLISFKQLRSKIDYTDTIFKFMPSLFTLEDVRIVYELVKNITVDKSNFRKKISKYCEKVDTVISEKGHRPTQMYKFKPLKNDIWL